MCLYFSLFSFFSASVRALDLFGLPALGCLWCEMFSFFACSLHFRLFHCLLWAVLDVYHRQPFAVCVNLSCEHRTVDISASVPWNTVRCLCQLFEQWTVLAVNSGTAYGVRVRAVNTWLCVVCVRAVNTGQCVVCVRAVNTGQCVVCVRAMNAGQCVVRVRAVNTGLWTFLAVSNGTAYVVFVSQSCEHRTVCCVCQSCEHRTVNISGCKQWNSLCCPCQSELWTQE